MANGLLERSALLARERTALALHRETLRGERLPAPRRAPRGTFVHGFLLPFSLIAATLRDRELRGPYLRLVLLRAVLVAVVAALVFSGPKPSKDKVEIAGEASAPRIVLKGNLGGRPGRGVHVHVPSVDIDLDGKADTADAPAAAATTALPDAKPESASPPPAGPPAPTPRARMLLAMKGGWAWLAALLGFLTTMEGIVVFFSRRWDDWLSFHASRLAGIRPEDETPTPPKLALDLRWLYRKLRRRARGYVVIAAGLPLLLPLRLVPSVGGALFTFVATLWAWYWLGVFSAAKSAHAWADEENAESPVVIRALGARVAKGWWCAPLRLYARAWAWVTRGMNPAATTFDRSPAPFLGLALARALLALPGLYLLARPIVPVAAGRLCAEADPADRFSQARP